MRKQYMRKIGKMAIALIIAAVVTEFGAPVATAESAAAWERHCAGDRARESVKKEELEIIIQHCQRAYSATARQAIAAKYLEEFNDDPYGTKYDIPDSYTDYVIDTGDAAKADHAANVADAAAAASAATEAAEATTAKVGAAAEKYAEEVKAEAEKDDSKLNAYYEQKEKAESIAKAAEAAKSAVAASAAAAKMPPDFKSLNAAAVAEDEAAEAVKAAFRGPEPVAISGVTEPSQPFDPEAEKKEQELAMRVANVLCDLDKKHSGGWYSDWSRIEASAPYELKGGGNPGAAARKALYDVSEFNADTRKAICGDLKGYAEKVKDEVIEMKGNISIECHIDVSRSVDADGKLGEHFNCATEEGLKKFFDTKLQAYVKITEYDEKDGYGGPKK
ncbi:hypothetical protein ACFYO1_18895 [Nocardia sp. NPDC006044]|uniref:hypothetical protein n=1 Tax=Nocardia sp. NPDC006044 TaxID=3364306 RepID=UPI003699579A